MSSDGYVDPFQFLGLERSGATESDVKKAYARKLKVTRPDDDPQGFMALRNAFTAARQELRWATYDAEDEAEDEDDSVSDTSDANAQSENRPDDVDVDKLPDTRPETAEDTDDDPFGLPPNAEEPAPQWKSTDGAEWEETEPLPIDEELDPSAAERTEPKPSQPMLSDADAANLAMEDILSLLDDEARRADWNAWLEILDSDSLSGIDAFQIMSARLRGCLCERTGFFNDKAEPTLGDSLTAHVFLNLDERFGWTHQTSANWHGRDQGIWMFRLRKEAEYQLMPPNPWGRPPDWKIESIDVRKSQSHKRQKKSTASAFMAISWIALRVVIIIALIRLIIYMAG